MTGQQLKNSILQLAIQGKLVPQIESEGTAEDLLKEIRAEKEKLVKEGKLKKKDLEVKPIEDDEIPFKIPKGWKWVRIKEICTKIVDGNHNPPIGIASKSEYMMLSSKNINYDKIVDLDSVRYLEKETFDIENQRTQVTCGDILFTSVGTLGRSCVFNDDSLNICFQRSVSILSTLIYNQYLKRYLDSPFVQSYVIDNATGTAQKGFYLNQLERMIVPLPPLSEQKRIVSKIEEMMPLVEEYGKAQEKLEALNRELPEKLKKSILQEAIMGKLVPQDPTEGTAEDLLAEIRKEKEKLVKEGKLKKKDMEVKPIEDDEIPFEIPEGWKWCRLGEIGSWGSGATPAKGKPEYYTNGNIPWLRTGELNNDYVYDSEIKVTQAALDECSLRMCRKGDVLIAMYGATIGKVAIAGIELTTNQACCACTPLFIYNKYLMWYLMASKQAFIDLGEGGAQPNISREKIVAFPFALPPLAEQKRIVEKVEEVMREIEGMK